MAYCQNALLISYSNLVLDPSAASVKKIKDKIVLEGKSLDLRCKASGAPRPTITFFKEGAQIASGVMNYRVRGNRLQVTKSSYPNHDGTYTCHAKNMFGEESVNVTVLVVGK